MSGKSNARMTACAKGHKHRSGWEAQYCTELSLLQRAGEILHYDWQPTVTLSCGQYKPDFCTWTGKATGTFRGLNHAEYIEVKGRLDTAFRRARKCFDAEHPAAPLTVIRKKGKGWERI